MKKILIIEDNEAVRENIAEILELSDYEVMTAENGKVGVAMASKNTPDLIICDVMMPELDGYGVLHILSKNARTANIPFVFLTAKAEKADFRKGMNLGADDYLTKPFDDVELLDVIDLRLNKKSRISQNFDKNKVGLETFINEAKGIQELEKLSSDRTSRQYRKKDFIFEEQGLPRQLYFIEEGKVKICKTNDEGKEYLISIAKKGDFIGYIPLLKNGRYTESAIALENTTVSLIPKNDFFTLIHSNRDVSNRFIKLLADNIIEKEDQLLSLAYNSVRQRVAENLIKLHKVNQSNKPISILREDLANMVGTAKETVIRTLADFKDEGAISVRASKITILKLDQLHKIVG